MATLLVGGPNAIYLTEGEDLRVILDDGAVHEALIYLAYGAIFFGLPTLTDELRHRLDDDIDDEELSARAEALGLVDFDRNLALDGLSRWHRLLQPAGEGAERDPKKMVLKFVGNWAGHVPAALGKVELETDMPDGPPLRWAAAVTFALVRASRQAPGTETLVGVEWEFAEPEVAVAQRNRGAVGTEMSAAPDGTATPGRCDDVE